MNPIHQYLLKLLDSLLGINGLLPALIMFADLLLGLEAHPIIDGLGSFFFILACMSVHNNFVKEEKQRYYSHSGFNWW